MLIGTAYAQQLVDNVSQTATKWFDPALLWTEVGLLILILLVAPIYAVSRSKTEVPFRGLNLPEGSIRAMLALLIVGSFINVLLFGTSMLGENFEQVVTAFGTLAGAVTGFYFAGRASSEGNHPPPPAEE